MPTIYKKISTTALSIFLALATTQAFSQAISDSNEPLLVSPEKNQIDKQPPLLQEKQEQPISDQENSAKQTAPIAFSDAKISEDAKITQIKIRNFEDLKKAGIKESEIYRMIHEFEAYAKNFFFKYEPSDGKVIFLITLSPLMENGRAIALEKGISIENDNDLKKFCSKDPTHCSVTSIVAIQNGKMPNMQSFEQGVYKNSNEIYWQNWEQDGKIDFMFEISLRSKQ